MTEIFLYKLEGKYKNFGSYDAECPNRIDELVSDIRDEFAIRSVPSECKLRTIARRIGIKTLDVYATVFPFLDLNPDAHDPYTIVTSKYVNSPFIFAHELGHALLLENGLPWGETESNYFARKLQCVPEDTPRMEPYAPMFDNIGEAFIDYIVHPDWIANSTRRAKYHLRPENLQRVKQSSRVFVKQPLFQEVRKFYRQYRKKFFYQASAETELRNLCCDTVFLEGFKNAQLDAMKNGHSLF